jgi:hypothetical protein
MLSEGELTPQRVETFRQALRQAHNDLRQRGLYFAAKWAAAQLNSLPKTPASDHVSRPAPQSDIYSLAISYFDTREFDRVAYVLEKNDCVDAASTFLRLYSKFLVKSPPWRVNTIRLAKREQKRKHKIISRQKTTRSATEFFNNFCTWTMRASWMVSFSICTAWHYNRQDKKQMP